MSSRNVPDIVIDISRFPFITERIAAMQAKNIGIELHRHQVLEHGLKVTLMVNSSDGVFGSEEDRRCDWCREVHEGVYPFQIPLSYTEIPRAYPDVIYNMGVCPTCRDRMQSVMQS